MSLKMIHIDGLSKRYGSVVAVDSLSLEVGQGAIFAFLGTNGAGKSTTIGCITTTLGFDTGNIRVAGHVVGVANDQIRRNIGVVFQNSVLDPLLTVRQNIDIRAGFYGLNLHERRQRIANLAELIGLEAFLDQTPYGRLSGGQKRRADIARALLHRPKILFLDEPTAGLDPQSRDQVWRTIHQLRRDTGLTVFLTTHYMEETEEADQVSIIDQGSLIAQGTPQQLRQQYSRSVLTLRIRDAGFVLKYCEQAGRQYTTKADSYSITVDTVRQAQEILALGGDNILDFEFRHGRMDDVFLTLTSKRSER